MEKIVLEFPVKSSVKVLFTALSSASGLSSWFCDDVKIIDNKKWSFIWDDVDQVAEVLEVIEDEKIKFRWVDEAEDTFFEFKIDIDEITGDMELVITDYVEEDDKDSSIGLWESQVKELFKSLGA